MVFALPIEVRTVRGARARLATDIVPLASARLHFPDRIFVRIDRHRGGEKSREPLDRTSDFGVFRGAELFLTNRNRPVKNSRKLFAKMEIF
jgi:hypothetical protein